ncbi:MAG: L,D-transpeptidase family protein [Gammaproteobacteria bacterium]|nr:L,D-transpeptidase family protein [Gammaproteobacteria bacterium]
MSAARIALTASLLLLLPGTGAEEYLLTPGNDVVGDVTLSTSVHADTLSDLARAHDQGYTEMRLANPRVDPWLPGEDTEILVPSQYVLPPVERTGIVINVPEMRLYYFPKPRKGQPARVITHPVSIGRQEWVTPKAATRITAKTRNPAWYPPKSIRAEHEAAGDPLPPVVPAGPDNPLGAFAMRLGLPGYLIHGSNKPYGIGMRVTHGCIRMYPKDIESIFEQVPVGTPVRIVNFPYKVGRLNDTLHLEVHPHLEEDDARYADLHTHVVKLIVDRLPGDKVNLQWGPLRSALKSATGMPAVIGSVQPGVPPQLAGAGASGGS